ncbi:MAG: DUF4097 domain-containing protein [Kangiellaceae bacterium]|nr:DUF4097 domain-containing protein [Kangiellaceae bacterium]MCW8997657.1 DUF4097 domain-containing protein [Kangiellaceae bacterium]
MKNVEIVKGLKLVTLLAAMLVPNQLMAKEVIHQLKLSDPSKPAKVDISLMVGNVIVEGYSGNEVEIRADKIEGQSKKNKKGSSYVYSYRTSDKDSDKKTKPSIKGLKKVANSSLKLEIEEEDNEVQIESHNSRDMIALKLRVPKNSSLEISVHRGDDITINNVHGEIEVEAGGVPITALGIKGPIVAESARSDLKVVFAEFNTEKPSSLTVHRGNIDITLPKNASAEVQVKSYDGDLYSGLPAEFKSIDQVEKQESGKKQQIVIGGAMSAKVNGGKQKLLLNTYRGDVFVRNK